MHPSSLFLFALMLLTVACRPGNGSTEVVDVPAPVIPDTTAPHPIAGPLSASGLRFDGVYISQEDKIFYLLRFFPQGNVTIINGPDTTNGDFLRGVIAKQDQEPNPVIGLYNVPVTFCDDSLHFVTKAMRGPIDYAGMKHTADSLRFLKHSHINGRRAIYTYRFSPDAMVAK